MGRSYVYLYIMSENEGIKYIATGWFYYLPVGNPKFDGHHPDENIQEIVV